MFFIQIVVQTGYFQPDQKLNQKMDIRIKKNLNSSGFIWMNQKWIKALNQTINSEILQKCNSKNRETSK